MAQHEQLIEYGRGFGAPRHVIAEPALGSHCLLMALIQISPRQRRCLLPNDLGLFL